MAVFGPQLVLSMIVATIISKLSPRISLARWLLCNTKLVRFLAPKDDELRELANVPKDISGKGKGKGKSKSSKDSSYPLPTFHVPKSIDVQLDSINVTSIEVMNLRFYFEYHLALDFSVNSTVVYFLTEIYYGLFDPQNEMNLSIFWCIISLGICVQVLCSLTKMYFRGDEVMGERAMCLVMGLVYLLIAMIVLIVDEQVLEVSLDPAYRAFQTSASEFMAQQGISTSGPASKLIIKFCIAVTCGFFGLLFTFPGIRMSRMFYDSLKYCEDRPMLKSLFYATFALPVVIILLWIKPIGRHYLTQASLGSANPLMTEGAFESMRIILVVLLVVSRIALMPYFLQSFLNTAQSKLYEQRKEAGRILNIEIQKQVAGVYYFLCIVAVQYITPCLICLHLCFLYKTLGGQKWTGDYSDIWLLRNATTASPLPPAPEQTLDNMLPLSDSFKAATEHFAVTLASIKSIFDETVFRGLLGFALWWNVFLMVASNAVGAFYLSYLSRA